MTNRLYYGDNLVILRSREYFPVINLSLPSVLSAPLW